MANIREHTGRLASLTPYDCWSLLEGRQVGRVAWGRDGAAPGVVPVNVRVLDGAIWFRTTPGSALAAEAAGQPVAVEVDEIDLHGKAGWSVVVEGVAEVVADEDVPDLQHTLEVWPEGDQSVHLRVEPLHVSGRRLLNPGASTP